VPEGWSFEVRYELSRLFVAALLAPVAVVAAIKGLWEPLAWSDRIVDVFYLLGKKRIVLDRDTFTFRGLGGRRVPIDDVIGFDVKTVHAEDRVLYECVVDLAPAQRIVFWGTEKEAFALRLCGSLNEALLVLTAKAS
jgi:hypothetical protein